MCLSCLLTFFTDPTKAIPVALSIIGGLILLTMFLKYRHRFSTRTRTMMLYGMLFFFIFPIIFYYYARTCSSSVFGCGQGAPIFLSFIMTSGLTTVLGYFLVPLLYSFSSNSRRIRENDAITDMVNEGAEKLRIKPPAVLLVDRAEPVAFALSVMRPSIFLSVGLIELLTKKELEAVVLHELAHVRQRSSFIKFTNSLFNVLLPVRAFNLLSHELDEEELYADSVAIRVQGSSLYLRRARVKMLSLSKAFAILNQF